MGWLGVRDRGGHCPRSTVEDSQQVPAVQPLINAHRLDRMVLRLDIAGTNPTVSGEIGIVGGVDVVLDPPLSMTK
jgi:hypothetical protein